jgi:hypothetical protein
MRIPRWSCFVPLLLVIGCHSGRASNGVTAQRPTEAPVVESGPLRDHTIGAPGVFENLAVFPVFAAHQEDIGEFTTLDAALEAKTAEVRELDAAPPPSSGAGGEVVNARGGAEVNKLVIENHGKLAVLVLAGTVVKGGRQDRQIGADFVIEAGKTVPVDAFCVEHGRWNGTRDGVETNGTFKSEKVLAQADVRAAGQYEHDQGAVWDRVQKVNADAKKQAATGTLTATLDDREMSEARVKLAAKVKDFLGTTKPSGNVVGLAYAVDGQVRAVRWFMNHKLFTLYSDTLVQTAALEAVTARVRRGSAPPPAAAAVAKDVTSFVDDVAAAPPAAASAEPAAGNVNHMKRTEAGYGSETMLKGASPKAVTSDFIKK